MVTPEVRPEALAWRVLAQRMRDEAERVPDSEFPGTRELDEEIRQGLFECALMAERRALELERRERVLR